MLRFQTNRISLQHITVFDHSWIECKVFCLSPLCLTHQDGLYVLCVLQQNKLPSLLFHFLFQLSECKNIFTKNTKTFHYLCDLLGFVERFDYTESPMETLSVSESLHRALPQITRLLHPFISPHLAPGRKKQGT